MRKLILKMSMTLDGFVCGPNGENDWVFKTGDAESLAWSVASAAQAGLIVMGRKSFETMAPYWPKASGPFAGPMNEIPKAVFTKNKGFDPADVMKTVEQSTAAATWTGAKVLSGDLAEQIAKLKAEPGKSVVALGGAGFARNLIASGLIDEYVFGVHPVALGAGLPIFTGLSSPLYLKLVDEKTFPGGITAKTYRPA